MPFATDPEQTVEVWLKSDEAKPEAARPVFLFRFLSCRQLRRAQELRELAAQLSTDAATERQSDETVCEMIRVGLAGWRNIGRVYDPSALDEVLTVNELWELAWAWPGRVNLSEREKKASGLPSPSATGGSVAASAPATASSASASPAPLSPSSSVTAHVPTAAATNSGS